MISLPVELKQQIFHHNRDSLPILETFETHPTQHMRHDQDYVRELLRYGLVSKDWISVSQSELFKNLIIPDDKKFRSFLSLLKRKKAFRVFALKATTIRFGQRVHNAYEDDNEVRSRRASARHGSRG
jgi:hypothetical protein